jgi:hypothetical protein
LRRLIPVIAVVALFASVPLAAPAAQSAIAKANFFDLCATTGQNEVDLRFIGSLGLKGELFHGVVNARPRPKLEGCTSTLQPFNLRGSNPLGSLQGTCTGVFNFNPNLLGLSTAHIDCEVTVTTPEATKSGPLSLRMQYSPDPPFAQHCAVLGCAGHPMTGRYFKE